MGPQQRYRKVPESFRSLNGEDVVASVACGRDGCSWSDTSIPTGEAPQMPVHGMGRGKLGVGLATVVGSMAHLGRWSG